MDKIVFKSESEDGGGLEIKKMKPTFTVCDCGMKGYKVGDKITAMVELEVSAASKGYEDDRKINYTFEVCSMSNIKKAKSSKSEYSSDYDMVEKGLKEAESKQQEESEEENED